MAFRSISCILATILLLSSCGFLDEAKANRNRVLAKLGLANDPAPSGPTLPNIDPIAAQRLTGGTSPTETAGELDDRDREIFRRSDSRVDTAIYFDFNDATRQDIVTVPNCSMSICEHRYPGGTFRTDLLSGTFVPSTPILTRNGITIYSIFRSEGVQIGSGLHNSIFRSGIYVDDISKERSSGTYGDLSGSKPPINGIWRGMMSGVLADSDDLLLGDAELTYSVLGSGETLRADFTNIANVTRNRAHTRPNVRFRPVPVSSDGTFNRRNSNSRIQGGFYGAAHSEVTGVFEHGGILGAFGTKRQNP